MKAISITIIVAGIILCGCSSSTPQASKEVEQNFKGAPMPADFAKQLEKEQKEGAAKAQSSAPK